MSLLYQKLDLPHFDYQPWLLEGTQNIWLRGPRPERPDYRVACAGGAQTFGRFTHHPFPAALADSLGCPVLNLGIGGAGPAMFLQPRLLRLLDAADVVILQIVSGRSASNSFFRSLHGGILGLNTATGEKGWLIDVVRDMVAREDTTSLRRLITETRDDYVASFRQLLGALTKPTIVLWFAPRSLDYEEDLGRPGSALGPFPQLIDRQSMQRIAEAATAYVEIRDPVGLPQRLWPATAPIDGAELRDGLLVNEYYPSPEMHDSAARALDTVIRQISISRPPPRAAPASKSRWLRPKSLDSRMTGKLSTLHVDAEQGAPEFPDFLLLGPPHMGCGWLAAALAKHPNIAMPSEPETGWLVRASRCRTNDRERRHSAAVTKYLETLRRTDEHREARNRECLALYGAPFDPRFHGEAASSYATDLEFATVDDLLRINPRMRFVLGVRDPADRAWAHALQALATATGRTADQVPIDEYTEFVTRSYQRRCGDFLSILRQWQSMVPDDNLLVVSFKDIVARPRDVLLRTVTFLGATPIETFLDTAISANPAPETRTAPPEPIRALLLDIHASARADLIAAGWL